jgi:hypothetical protein
MSSNEMTGEGIINYNGHERLVGLKVLRGFKTQRDGSLGKFLLRNKSFNHRYQRIPVSGKCRHCGSKSMDPGSSIE